MAMNIERWKLARGEYEGYCEVCQDWTRDCTEPDAEGYDCPECEEPAVIGADMVLIAGMLEED